MNFFAAGYSDVGNVKKINQDSMLLKIAKCPLGEIAYGVVCDGMGGLNSGEVASAHVIRRFDSWFCERLPLIIKDDELITAIQEDWEEMVFECNKQIMSYGESKGFNLGTTLTAICIVGNHYITVNVGDSRIYIIKDDVSQITTDQTVVEKEIQEGKLRREDAEKDSRRNVLLQCIGASNQVIPDFTVGEIDANAVVLLCSDGFRHTINDNEVYACLGPDVLKNAAIAKENLKNIIGIVKKRGERDNITAAIIKTVG